MSMDEDFKILYLIIFFFITIVLFIAFWVLGSGTNDKIFRKKYLSECLEAYKISTILYVVLLIVSCIILNSGSWL